jgi:hypothetical protein
MLSLFSINNNLLTMIDVILAFPALLLTDWSTVKKNSQKEASIGNALPSILNSRN